MLKLENISKSYTTGDFTQIALNKVNLNFRKSEFVAILGSSGSGKTTCLNVIGGLDQYDSGDLIINGKSTQNFLDSDWDAYRNNSVGFIFQSYNLINHLNIVDNVELGMTLSGMSSSKKHTKALEVLEKVGLKEHINKKPNQLSGGQMQRVAIARAIVNNPDIILADEPTGALDSITSDQIIGLIKEIAKDKLVIMVTHNPDLAGKYADRIIQFKDGEVIADSNPYEYSDEVNDYILKKTSMSFFTALKLSGKNIATKKWRTTLTAFASSIGLIGIALILSISSGFEIKINKFQNDALSEFPIIISKLTKNIDTETMEKMRGEVKSMIDEEREKNNSDKIYLYDSEKNNITHTNKITDDYLEYLKVIDPSICRSIGYTRISNINLLRREDGETFPVSISIGFNRGSDKSIDLKSIMNGMSSMRGIGLSSYPSSVDASTKSYIEKNYDLLAGRYPNDDKDLVLVVDDENKVDYTVFKNLGFDTDKIISLKFSDIVNIRLKLITNNDFFYKSKTGNYIPNTNYENMYNSINSIPLNICGVVRLKEDVSLGILGNGIAYSDNLIKNILEIEENSDIVLAQKKANYNVMTFEKLDDESKEILISTLGGDSTPLMIQIYPIDFKSKDAVLAYLDKYNNHKLEEDTIIYDDLAKSITDMTGSIMHAITLVLIAFAAISLVVSLIMIGIITYISVLERTKEIGILRALGARKKDITRVFNAETFIIGAFSGFLAIAIAYFLIFPVNAVLQNMTGLADIARFNPVHGILLVTISIALTLAGGTIPAKLAAKKDPVEALRAD